MLLKKLWLIARHIRHSISSITIICIDTSIIIDTIIVYTR